MNVESTNEQMQSGTYKWSLSAFQRQGNLWLAWNTDAPFRAQQGQIHVYKGQSFPQNPTDNSAAWNWDTSNSPWDTGLRYGSDWYCAYIAQSPPNGPYVYMIQLTTKDS